MGLAVWCVIAAVLAVGPHRTAAREIKNAERATNGSCAVVSDTGVPADVLPDVQDGVLLMPVKRVWGDHQIACIPLAVMSRPDALSTLKGIRARANGRATIRENGGR